MTNSTYPVLGAANKSNHKWVLHNSVLGTLVRNIAYAGQQYNPKFHGIQGITFIRMLETEFKKQKIYNRLVNLRNKNAHSVNSIRKVLPLIVVNRNNGVKRFKMTSNLFENIVHAPKKSRTKTKNARPGTATSRR